MQKIFLFHYSKKISLRDACKPYKLYYNIILIGIYKFTNKVVLPKKNHLLITFVLNPQQMMHFAEKNTHGKNGVILPLAFVVNLARSRSRGDRLIQFYFLYAF